MRLLIVEDERPLANVLKKGFEEHAFTVDLAFDGEDGLFRAEFYDFDAIILDIMLPKMDGLAVLNALRKKGKDTCEVEKSTHFGRCFGSHERLTGYRL